MSKNQDIRAAKEIFAAFPRRQLGFFPTPLHKLERMSEELGVELYLKRDDLTGQNVYGGNKMRKLEFLLGDALEKGASYVFTYGATQSNHAMQTATACRQWGLEPVLYLVALVPPQGEDYRSNLLLTKILGAEIHIISPEQGMTLWDAVEIAQEEAKGRIKELEAQGKTCYEIPVGGANIVGSIGFAAGFIELMEQLTKLNLGKMDYLVHATGSGGTLAGLAAGKALLGEDIQIVAFQTGPKSPEHAREVADLVNEVLLRLGSKNRITARDLNINPDYFGAGYEIPSADSSQAIKLLARKEGVLFDPVYTGKAMAGLLHQIKSGEIPQGSKVVFWHTGGATALFAEREMVGEIY